MRQPFPDPFAHLATPSAPGDRLVELTGFGGNPGALRARVHVPARLAERPALVVVLHGCTQTAAGYDHGSGWSRLADRHGFVLLYPEQTRANNANLCFNWFEPGDIVRDGGEARSIHAMIEAVVDAHGIDRRRIFVTGLSAGGAMASVMLATYPETFAGGAIIAGLPYGCAANAQEAFGAMRASGRSRPEALAALVRRASPHSGPWPTVSVWHGSRDATVDPANAQAIVDQWLPIHGIAGGPSTTDMVDGHPHRAWRAADGRVAVEAYAVTGMGHGTPLDPRGADPLGVAGPYMLDAGIASSRRIAQSWGLTTDTVAQPEPAERGAGDGPRRPPADRKPAPALDVRRIIEHALKAGGLMK